MKFLAEQRCSFCGRPSAEVSRLIAGPGIYICDGCVNLCVELLQHNPAGGQGAVPEWADMSDAQLLDHLPRIAGLVGNVEAGLQDRVADLRRRGVSWARIGEALGMSRQAAWERFHSTAEGAA